MSYKITISGGTILEQCIDHIAFSAVNSRNSVIITGKVDTDESTVVLYNWALLPPTNPECYKEIIIEQYQKELLIRKVTFSQAFVIDYSETYSNCTGSGTFTLYIRQFFEKGIEVTSEETNKPVSTAVSEVTDKAYEPAGTVQEKVAVIESIQKADKTTMSVTDRIAKQSEEIDLSSLSDDELRKVFEKEIEQSKKALEKAMKIKEETKLEGCIASNGKVTVSGFSKNVNLPDTFTRVPLETMFQYCDKIGHKLPAKTPKFLDNGKEGSFFACHAEKQLSLLTDKPIGISKPMCPNCVGYFSKHAIHTKQVKITTDPKKTRIFFPNGVIREL